MQSGPKDDIASTATPTPDRTRFGHSIPWPQVGAAFVSVGTEQALFYPFDTFVKNALHSRETQKAFLTEIRSQSFFTAIGRSYQGLLEAYKKKGIQRGQKWFFQDTANQWLKNNHKAHFEAAYGPYAHVVMAGIAGGFTGLMEPLFVQYFDTKQVRKQLAKKGEIHPKLSIRDGYRATFFTGFARNLPGSIGLFGGSELFNSILDNQDKSNPYLNFGAKLGGAGVSAIVSQPGDVIKTKMQKEFISARQAIKKTSFKEMMTNGFGPRVALNSVKVAFGFFVYEQMVKHIESFFKTTTNFVTRPRAHETREIELQSDTTIHLESDWDELSEIEEQLEKFSITNETTPSFLSTWESYQIQNSEQQANLYPQQSSESDQREASSKSLPRSKKS